MLHGRPQGVYRLSWEMYASTIPIASGVDYEWLVWPAGLKDSTGPRADWRNHCLRRWRALQRSRGVEHTAGDHRQRGQWPDRAQNNIFDIVMAEIRISGPDQSHHASDMRRCH